MNNRKIFKNVSEFIPILNKIKKTKRTIAFTNGCFDLLHVGHVDYLKSGSLMGNIFIIGLNTDSSIKRLKGESRPIITFEQRALFLSYFDFVDYIIGFEEDTPINLIKKIIPNILIKGGDYKEENIVGSDFVKANQGQVKLVDFIYNISSTEIINKIRGEEK